MVKWKMYVVILDILIVNGVYNSLRFDTSLGLC